MNIVTANAISTILLLYEFVVFPQISKCACVCVRVCMCVSASLFCFFNQLVTSLDVFLFPLRIMLEALPPFCQEAVTIWAHVCCSPYSLLCSFEPKTDYGSLVRGAQRFSCTKEIITYHQTSTFPSFSSVFKLATVDCFSPIARIDKLLLTGIRVRYWRVDKTLQITEKTSPQRLLSYVPQQCVVGNVCFF